MRIRSSLLILAMGCVVVAVLARVLTPSPSQTPTSELLTPDVERSASFRITSRVLAKDAICQEVRAKRLPLLEAAAVIGWLNEQQPIYPVDCFHAYHIPIDQKLLASAGECEIALLCLQIIIRIENQDGLEAETTLAVKEQYLQLCQTGWDIPLPRISEPDCRELLARAMSANARGRWGQCNFNDLVLIEGLSLIKRSH